MNLSKAPRLLSFLEKSFSTLTNRGVNDVSSSSILNKTEVLPHRQKHGHTNHEIKFRPSYGSNIQPRFTTPRLHMTLAAHISYTKDPLNQKEKVKNAITQGGVQLPSDPYESAWLVEETHKRCLIGAVNIHADVPASRSAKTPEIDHLKFATGWTSTAAKPEFKVLTSDRIFGVLAEKIGGKYDLAFEEALKNSPSGSNTKEYEASLKSNMLHCAAMKKAHQKSEHDKSDISKDGDYCPAYLIVAGPNANKMSDQTRLAQLQLHVDAIKKSAESAGLPLQDIKIGYTLSPYHDPESMKGFHRNCQNLIEAAGMQPVTFIDLALRAEKGEYITDLQDEQVKALSKEVGDNVSHLVKTSKPGSIWATDDIQAITPQTLAIHKVISEAQGIKMSTPSHINQEAIKNKSPGIKLEDCSLDTQKLEDAAEIATYLARLNDEAKSTLK